MKFESSEYLSLTITTGANARNVTGHFKTFDMTRYFIILWFCFSTYLGSAQVIVDTGRVWNVVECLNFGPCVTFQYRFDGDSIINSIQYKVLLSNDSGSIATTTQFLAREDTVTHQVYFYSGGTEYLKYDFSLIQGDTFTTEIEGSCLIQMIVDSVDSVTLINGEVRKRMYLSNFWTDTWIEGIGSLYGPTYMGVYFCISDLYPELNCFSEHDSIKYENLNYASCFYNTLGLEEHLSRNDLKIIPNPVLEQARISFPNVQGESKTINIYSSYNKLLRRYQSINGEVEFLREGLTSGVYYVQLITSQGSIIMKRIVII